MWRSFLDALAEGFAMTDPFAYSYYVACKRQADVKPEPSRRTEITPKESERPRGRGREVSA